METNTIVIIAAAVALVAGGIGAYAAYKAGGRKALQSFLDKLFTVVDAIWRSVQYYDKLPLTNEKKLGYVLDEAVATARSQGIGDLLSRDLLLKIIEGTVTFSKRMNEQPAPPRPPETIVDDHG
jgi:hypothetical protein